MLMAADRGAAVIIDEGAEYRFAQLRNLATYNTRDVVVRMVVCGALTADEGSVVWAAV